jgi:putative glutamine amidotransferase
MHGAAASSMPTPARYRGSQEMNMAFDGRLHTDIYVSGHFEDQFEDHAKNLLARYRPRHEVESPLGDAMSALANRHLPQTNSRRRQGVATLAPRLVVKARPQDGLIEAYRLDQHEFTPGVPWHSNAMPETHALSHALFEAFCAAGRRYRHTARQAIAHHEG